MKKRISWFLIPFFISASVSAQDRVIDVTYGNDRIIMAAQFHNDEAYHEGLQFGGDVYSAYLQCMNNFSSYKNTYKTLNVCNNVKTYNHNEFLHRDRNSVSIWGYMAVPLLMVTVVVIAIASKCAYRKLKQY